MAIYICVYELYKLRYIEKKSRRKTGFYINIVLLLSHVKLSVYINAHMIFAILNIHIVTLQKKREV